MRWLKVGLVVAWLGIAVAAEAVPLVRLSETEILTKNFVRNGDFESDWGSVPKWSLDTTVKVAGHSALRAVGNAPLVGRVNQEIDLKVGETYTLSAWMKSEELTSLRPGDDSVGVKVFDLGWHWATGIAPAAPTTDWQRYSVTFQAPPTARLEQQLFTVVIYLPQDETGVLWVDNLQVERGTAATEFTAKAIPDLYRSVELINRAYAAVDSVPAALAQLTPATEAVAVKRQEAERLRQGLETVAGRVTDFADLSDEDWAEVVARVEELSQAVERSQGWEVWWTNPWERQQLRAAPASWDKPSVQKLRLAVNDYAPLALMITNLTGQSQEIRARLLPATGGYAAYMQPSWATLRQARRVSPTYQPDSSYPTLLARLDNTNTIQVGPGETTQLWIDVDTAGMEPGSYPMQLELTPYSNLKPMTLSVEVEVVPVILPKECPAEVFCFGSYPINEGSIGITSNTSQEEMDRRNDPWLRDLVKHGVNRFMHHTQNFTPKFAEDGSLAEPIDFTRHDKELASIRRWFDKLASGYSVAQYHLPAVPDEDFERKFATLMKAWLGHLQELGIDLTDFPLELLDEPSGEKLEKNRVAYRVLKEAVPEAQTYAAISMDTPASLRSVAEIMDIMVINPRIGEAAHAVLQHLDKEIWTYVCLGTLEKLHPYSYYRLLPWQTWRRGYSGFGFTYSMRGTDSVRGNMYSHYYFGAEGPVPSRGWQGFWRGTRDWAYLHTLRGAISQARQAGKTEQANAAEQIMEQAVAEVAANPDDTSRADKWREEILDQLVALAAE